MGTEDRLKGILARQAAAAKSKQRDQEQAQLAAEEAKLLRASVIQKWRVQRAHIEKFIDQINQQIGKNGVRLFVGASGHTTSESAMEVDKMEVRLSQHIHESRKLGISVRPNGEIYVSMATADVVSPAKHYVLNALEATTDQLEGAVLDFLDLNTPK